ncbi:hypothetical protein HU200_063688 [Digitaria exilis]|uniref:Uncharacterized protein n=1 Tax=Digitaria exilis TaxID=1010633 RepID=A0A835A6Y9_9POAL|nr:hypothetical protein HU200_063688 [Digitaria exilis]
MMSRKQLQKESRKAFDSMVELVTWSIWLERNARTFNRQEQTAMLLVEHIMEEANIWTQARYTALVPFLLSRHQSNAPLYTGRELAIV